MSVKRGSVGGGWKSADSISNSLAAYPTPFSLDKKQRMGAGVRYWCKS